MKVMKVESEPVDGERTLRVGEKRRLKYSEVICIYLNDIMKPIIFYADSDSH